MAGVKGRSGGKRPGAGRKPATVEVGDPANRDALDFLLSVMNDQTAPIAQRVRAAVAAAQYQHHKAGDGGKKDGQAEAAKKAASKFSAAAPPKLVVNNRG